MVFNSSGVGSGEITPARACGDVPEWTNDARWPSPAPRVSGDGSDLEPLDGESDGCSLHLRGWSHDHASGRERRALLPAPAGVAPHGSSRPCRAPSAPARAGMLPPAVRRRPGDGPRLVLGRLGGDHFSPRVWGWSHRRARVYDDLALLLAPARMVPRCARWLEAPSPASRTRGDGRADNCSPRPQGWSPAPRNGWGPRALLPA